MAKKKIFNVPFMFIVSVILTVCIKTSTVYAENDFYCYTVDDFGNVIYGYEEKDGEWYIFATSSMNLSDIRIYYTGDIAEISAAEGRIAEEEKYIENGFRHNGDFIYLTMKSGDMIKITVKQSALPSVQLKLNGTTLSEIHQDKNIKYPRNTIYIKDPGNPDNDLTGTVEVKGRGNTSWLLFEKKGYQIKFDKKTEVLGMDAAKKWILLSNSSDDSMLRNMIAFNLAKQLGMEYVTDYEYVDLWIDGDYRGTYILGEKVEIGSGRLNLKDSLGAVFELDDAFYAEEDYYFYDELSDHYFVLKESVNDKDGEIIQNAVAAFHSALDEFLTYIYACDPDDVKLEDLERMIDVDSFIKYYLVNEYMMNRESFGTSFYWYMDGPSYEEYYGSGQMMFQYLFSIPAFSSKAFEVYEENLPLFENIVPYIQELYYTVKPSADMNYIRYDVLGKENGKGILMNDTYEDAVSELTEWLKGRYEHFSVPALSSFTSFVSDDFSSVMLLYKALPENESDIGTVQFAIWSDEGG